MKKYKIITPTDTNYPMALKTIANIPRQLYVMGDDKILNDTCFSIIGSRTCTERGKKVAEEMAKKLCEYNVCIVSGLALGIDTAAHRGALLAGGKTIAILGSGFEHIYPERNISLAENILKNGGALVTEYPPEEPVKSMHFPKRNRIVSGLSIGTLVVEAHYRSGTSITAKLAAKQGRKVFAIPSGIGEKYGVITNELIKKGAILTRNIEDIIKEYDFLQKIERKKESELTVPQEYKEIYDILSTKEMQIEEIRKRTKKDAKEINYLLTMMELEGYIKQLPGKFYTRR